MHTESDLRLLFAWCAEQHLAPLAAQRVLGLLGQRIFEACGATIADLGE